MPRMWHGSACRSRTADVRAQRYQPLRPKWWKTIFDQAHVTLDCHNPHEDDPARCAPVPVAFAAALAVALPLARTRASLWEADRRGATALAVALTAALLH